MPFHNVAKLFCSLSQIKGVKIYSKSIFEKWKISEASSHIFKNTTQSLKIIKNYELK